MNNKIMYYYVFACTTDKCEIQKRPFATETNNIPMDECPFCHKKARFLMGEACIGEQKIASIKSDGSLVAYNAEQSSSSTNTSQQTTTHTKNDEDLVRCPRCGSTQITTGARGVNNFWGLLGASKTVNRCAKCGNTWKPHL